MNQYDGAINTYAINMLFFCNFSSLIYLNKIKMNIKIITCIPICRNFLCFMVWFLPEALYIIEILSKGALYKYLKNISCMSSTSRSVPNAVSNFWMYLSPYLLPVCAFCTLWIPLPSLRPHPCGPPGVPWAAGCTSPHPPPSRCPGNRWGCEKRGCRARERPGWWGCSPRWKVGTGSRRCGGRCESGAPCGGTGHSSAYRTNEKRLVNGCINKTHNQGLHAHHNIMIGGIWTRGVHDGGWS